MEYFAIKRDFITFVTFILPSHFILMKILVTGASGFIGSFIVKEAIDRGMEVWAAVRKSSSREYLSDKRINFIELDLSSEDRLREQLTGHVFDYVVHAAGVTKCSNSADFRKVNTEGTRNLVNTIINMGIPIKRMVFISSLSVFGAIREKMPYAEISNQDTPQPNTEYGRSKLEAEKYIDSLESFPCVTLRPTGVYGPREKDYFLMAQSISRHMDFAVGYKRQDITFVYVMDVVQAVYKCMASEQAVGKAYFLSDGQVYNSRRFSDLLQQSMGNPWVLHIQAPLWFLRIVCAMSGALSRMTGRMNALNMDKYHILRQRNWQCDITPAMRDFGYEPEWGLERGVKAAVAWYKAQGWL